MREDRQGEEDENRGHHGHGGGRRAGFHGLGLGRGFGGPHGGRGHSGGRIFEHGEVRLVMLKLIAEQPSHGYELIKRVAELLGGAYAPSPGLIYPTLTMLEEMGLIEAAGTDGGKKLFTITAEGRALLKANRAATSALLARMEQAAAMHGRGQAPPILRAIENLRMTIRLKTQAAALSETQVHAIAEAIDGAARKIERC